mmetsp:Transcript_48601/g.80595  ORF Transcript_48601/g.80595 Transcript_48601/m.80595 type:complete len:272 (-) Transcript_48601:194-1009(-)|eukprot:CAMPEP_0202686682 /NCGR_PEP_ID=MMETSP1385-20130828/2437_1 /ASSEMBLY_ACC=CAM_ASM_000861 /TAXON_ID=933848 /ORGANISM="Elphidium margaritaceum" /LENGTH=271 /DNA_ID=CAMNT_0049341311 /DNA_START=61 /DNA_END=876 /DNA_ORIENTATION=+
MSTAEVLPKTQNGKIVGLTQTEEKQATPPSFRITYFAFGGRAAPLRLAAFLGGLSYEDNFETFDEHGQAKKNGTRRWSGMPELTVFEQSGKEVMTIGQSNACLRYIGSRCTLYPENPVWRALVDEILDSVEDIICMMTQSAKERDKEKKKKAGLKLMDKEKLPYWLSKFEQRLQENEERGFENGFFVGPSLTIADLKFYFQIDKMLSGNLEYIDVNKLVEPCPKVARFARQISELDGVKKFKSQFSAQQKQYKETKKTRFILGGKTVYGAL